MFFSQFFKKVPTVAINLVPRKNSWGGANQWTAQVSRYFQQQGWKVRYDLKKPVDAILMTHTGLSAGTSFDADDVARFKEKYPKVRCLHRINDNNIRKGTSKMDLLLEQSSRVADHTVFVSAWLRDHHAERWFDRARPHSVITPGADPRVFFPFSEQECSLKKPLRLVTHHWSDHWNKGFDIYQKLDELIASKKQGVFELWVIGRWPTEIEWKTARTFSPTAGAPLGRLLRQCHGYITASRYEPGAMHVAEGLQSGLPILYHRDSGGTVEQGRRYGLEIQNDLEVTLDLFKEQYAALRTKLLADPPSGDKMAKKYFELVQKLLNKSSFKMPVFGSDEGTIDYTPHQIAELRDEGR